MFERTDSDRLDDIEKRGYSVACEIEYINGVPEWTWFCVFGINRIATGGTLREAIDAAHHAETGGVH